MLNSIQVDQRLNEMMNETKAQSLAQILSTKGLTDAEKVLFARRGLGEAIFTMAEAIDQVDRFAEHIEITELPVVEAA